MGIIYVVFIVNFYKHCVIKPNEMMLNHMVQREGKPNASKLACLTEACPLFSFAKIRHFLLKTSLYRWIFHDKDRKNATGYS